jgi:hypothetical protein
MIIPIDLLMLVFYTPCLLSMTENKPHFLHIVAPQIIIHIICCKHWQAYGVMVAGIGDGATTRTAAVAGGGDSGRQRAAAHLPRRQQGKSAAAAADGGKWRQRRRWWAARGGGRDRQVGWWRPGYYFVCALILILGVAGREK